MSQSLARILDLMTNHMDLLIKETPRDVENMFNLCREYKQENKLSPEDMATIDAILELEPSAEKYLKMKVFW